MRAQLLVVRLEVVRVHCGERSSSPIRPRLRVITIVWTGTLLAKRDGDGDHGLDSMRRWHQLRPWWCTSRIVDIRIDPYRRQWAYRSCGRATRP
jgi:hypothetical protein